MAGEDSPTDGGRPVRADAWALLALVGIAFGLWQWNVLRTGDVLFSLTNFDLYSEFFPRHHFSGASLQQGRLPLWDPHQIAGLPFLATYQGGILYPPNWLYALLPTGFCMGLLGFLHLAAAGAFTYALCREFELERAAAWLGALVFMVGGSTLFASFHTNAMNSVPWLPAALLCCARLARTPTLRCATLLALCIALQFLAGREYTFVMTVHAVGLLVLFQLTWRLRDGGGLRSALRPLGALAVAGVLAAGLVAAQALPTLSLAAESGRTLAGLAGDQLEIYNPMSPAFFLANLVNPAAGAIRREYFGWIPLVCAVIGFRLWGPPRPMVFASTLSLLALLLCFGSSTPVYDLYRHLPLASTFRLPDRFVFLLSLGLSLLAAGGLDRVVGTRGRDAAGLRTLAPRLALLAAAAIALPFVLHGDWLAAGIASAAEPWGWFAFYGFPPDHFARIGLATAWFAAALAIVVALVLLRNRATKRAFAIALLGLAAMDLAHAQRNRFLHPATSPAPALAGSDCHEKAAAVTGDYGRFLGFRLPKSYAIKDKDGELFARHSATHYDPMVTRRHAAYFAALELGGTPFYKSPWEARSLFMGFLTGTPAPDRSRLLDLLGTRALLVDGRSKIRPAPLSALLRGYRRVARCVASGESGPIPVDIHVNPNAFPRAYLVHEVESADSTEAALARVMAADFDPLRSAVVEGESPPVEQPLAASGERAEIVVYEAQRVVVRVRATAPGLLVLADSFDRDWVALRDGREIEVLPTNGLFRGVAVPSGDSELLFRYRPRAFRFGAAVSGASLLLVGALWFGPGQAQRSRLET